jgi:hypothetical protein
MGGLGNQLFQFAAARAVAERLGLPLAFDLSEFERDKLRRFELEHFQIAVRPATEWELLPLRAQRTVFRPLIPSRLRFCEVRETVHSYREIQIPAGVSRLYLSGYWQSERYFLPIADLIRAQVRMRGIAKGPNADLLRSIRSTEAVCLHVRRGDYITNPVAAAWLGACGLDYYDCAVAYIEAKIQRPHFFVFSDDIPWARESLRISHPVTYVDHNLDAPVEDLRLMSSCKHFIIANSSFSWWGAWLSENPNKLVVAPKKWFSTPDKDDSDQVPKTWIRV